MSETVAPEPQPKEPKQKGGVFLDPVEPGTSPILIKGARSRRYLTWYTLLTISITAVWGAVLGIVLPNHVQILEFGQWFTGANAGVDLQALTILQQQVAAGTATATSAQAAQLELLTGFDASRAQALAIITSVGVVLTMIVQPIVGVFADRTRTRWGRRAPWILFGTVVGGLLLSLLQLAPSIFLLGLGFMLAQAVINMALGPLTTTVADRMPENRRGVASALGGC